MERRCTTESCLLMAGTKFTLDLPVVSVLTRPRQEWNTLAHGHGGVRVARDIEVDWGTFTADSHLFTHCFPAGTEILMADGTGKPIESIIEGDMVLSHKGISRAVKATMIREVDEELVGLDVASVGKVFSTSEHPYWIIPKEKSWCVHNKGWKKCIYGVGGRCKKWSCSGNGEDCSFVEAGDIKAGDLTFTPSLHGEVDNTEFGLGRFRLLGYYTAEGRIDKDDRGNAQDSVRFSISRKELDTIGAEIISLMSDCFGTDSYSKFGDPLEDGVTLSFTGNSAASWFRRMVGVGSLKKRFSFDVMVAPKEYQVELLDAWIAGDGNLGKRDSNVRLSTSSKYLASQAEVLFDRVGALGIKHGMKNSGGPTNRDKECFIWQIDVQNARLGMLASRFPAKEYSRWPRTGERYRHAACVVSKIRSVSRKSFKGTVYNLSVDIDESYVAERCAVHNCTIVASVAAEENGYHIKPACNGLVNNNGNAWTNEVLLSTFRSFVGGENYLEHIQIPELSKGKILDAVLRPVTYKDSQGREADVYYCFSGESKVLLADGSVSEIKDILPGVEVISGDGTVQEVLALSHRFVPSEDLVKVSVRGVIDDTAVTGNHGLWAKKNLDEEWGWVEANCLEKNWWVLQPTPDICGDKKVSSDFAWLTGEYAAEGSLVQRKGADGSPYWSFTQFTCHIDEKDVITKATESVLDEMGTYDVPFFRSRWNSDAHNIRKCSGSIDSRDKGNGSNIRVGHRELASRMFDLCGKGAASKSLSSEILVDWDDESKLHFLAGLIDGDGHARRNVVSVKSVSNGMIRQVEFILSSLGMAYSSTGNWHNGPYSGCVTIELDCYSSDRLRPYLRIKNGFDKPPVEVSMNNRASLAVDGGIARRVSETQKMQGEVEIPVYNIEVSENHTYIVHNVKVKNCDILVATDRRHAGLVTKIAGGKLNTMSMGCGIAGTPVTMADGATRPVEDIVVGDKVITHTGGIAEVESTRVRQTTSGELRRLSVTGIPDTYVTSEHPYWALTGYDVCTGCGKEMGRSKAISWSLDQVLHPWCSSSCRQRHVNSNPKCKKSFEPIAQKVKFGWVPVSELRKGDYVAVPLGRPEKDRRVIDRFKARLLGYYAAEGNLQRAKNGHIRAVEFTLHADEPAGDEIVELAREWGITEDKIYSQVRKRKSGKSRRIVIHDSGMAKWLKKTCGEHCDKKRLESWVLDACDDSLLEVLGSYISGDGHCRKDSARFTTASCSRSLSEQVLTMLMAVGIPANISLSQQKGKKPAWYVNTRKGHAGILKGRTSKFLPQQENNAKVSSVGGYMLRRVKSNVSVDLVCDVFNIHVVNSTNDHSYIMNGIAVHNCLADYVQCSRCGKIFADSEPSCEHIERQLLQSFTDEDGVERIVAELCGRTLVQDGNRVGDEGSCNFIEASWVERPAFYGAVLNHYLTELPVTAQVLQFSTPKLAEVVDDIFRLRVADRAGMITLRVARAELMRRKRKAMVSRVANSFM